MNSLKPRLGHRTASVYIGWTGTHAGQIATRWLISLTEEEEEAAEAYQIVFFAWHKSSHFMANARKHQIVYIRRRRTPFWSHKTGKPLIVICCSPILKFTFNVQSNPFLPWTAKSTFCLSTVSAFRCSSALLVWDVLKEWQSALNAKN